MKIKLKIHFLIIAISLTSLLGGYIQSLSAPIYASDDWQTLTSNEQLVDAFRAYCKSRNTVIDGSLLDAVTSFTTTTFNNLCNTLGIDVTLLQAELQRSYTGSGYKYAFSQLGLSTYNRIFAEFLQNNDLSVGDNVEDLELYSGEYFTSLDGHSSLIYYTVNNVTGASPSQSYGGDVYSVFSKLGNSFIYDSDYMSAYYTTGLVSPTINLTDSLNVIYTFQYTRNYNSDILTLKTNINNYTSSFYRSPGKYPPNTTHGRLIIYKNPNGSLYCGVFWTSAGGTVTCSPLFPISGSHVNKQSCYIYVTTNNTTINNETVINEGDTYIIDSDGEPGGGGSGGGSDDDDWDPSVPVIPPAGGGTGNNNTIDWPDIDIPDFNLPDFSLGDITDKFPFSIPFDLVALLTVLDGEPIAPHIEGTIPLGNFYTWDLDFDFSQFDDYARIFRAFEFIGFCIGLIYFTVRIVKG